MELGSVCSYSDIFIGVVVSADQLDFEGVATLEYLRQEKRVVLIDSLVAGNLQTLDSYLPD